MEQDEKYFVILGMEKSGGDFVKGLCLALKSADHINVQKVKSTWPEYWEKYLKVGKIVHEREEKE